MIVVRRIADRSRWASFAQRLPNRGGTSITGVEQYAAEACAPGTDLGDF